ncbi:hypothetical protein JL721_10845 [Aureococcus anophagefferens]|nr:hypothetical protein JL721_10845 [Aureococcus anophagefferens]
MKVAAKKLKGSGVGIGAVDVEPNSGIQAMFPDIRGFPSLKYVRSGKNSAKTAIDYNGPREADDIERWTKEQFKKYGGALAEPAAAKSKGKPLFSAAYGFDGDTREAFNSSGLGAGAYNLFVAAVDRKNLGKSLVAPYAGNPIVAKRKKVDDVAAVEAFARAARRPAPRPS